MMDIAAAISSTATMLGLAKSAIAARDESKAQQAITEVQLKLLEVSNAALSLSQTNIALTDEIRTLKDKARQLEMKASERDGYTLTEACPGTYAYKSSHDQDAGNTKSHYLCQPCYDKGVKSVLRFLHNKKSEWNSENMAWDCPENKDHAFCHYP